jgi:hypothetical protein
MMLRLLQHVKMLVLVVGEVTVLIVRTLTEACVSLLFSI